MAGVEVAKILNAPSEIIDKWNEAAQNIKAAMERNLGRTRQDGL